MLTIIMTMNKMVIANCDPGFWELRESEEQLEELEGREEFFLPSAVSLSMLYSLLIL